MGDFKLVSMTDEEFDLVVTHLKNISRRTPLDSTLQMCRTVLVEGLTLSEAAQKYNVTRQRVSTVVEDFHTSYKTYPEKNKVGVLSTELVFPASLADDVERLQDSLKKDPSRITEIKTIRGRQKC